MTKKKPRNKAGITHYASGYAIKFIKSPQCFAELWTMNSTTLLLQDVVRFLFPQMEAERVCSPTQAYKYRQDLYLNACCGDEGVYDARF